MAELKPCPFCGATPIIERRDVEPQGDPWYGDKVVRFVLCECGVSLFDRYFHEGFDSNEEAIAAWNTRATDGQRAGVPEGHVLVPVEPTDEMRLGAWIAWKTCTGPEQDDKMQAALREAIAAAPTPPDDDVERDGWQPIDTAPRTGRQMILLLTPSRWPQVAWSNTWWTAGFSVECKPTHWMPLPAVPSSDAAMAASKGEKVCRCTMREKLVGDGCEACNRDEDGHA